MMRQVKGHERGGKWVNDYWGGRYMKKENRTQEDYNQTGNYWVIHTMAKKQGLEFKVAEKLFLEQYGSFKAHLKDEDVRDFIYEHKEDEGIEEYWREREEREEEEINRLIEDLEQEYEYNALRRRWR